MKTYSRERAADIITEPRVVGAEFGRNVPVRARGLPKALRMHSLRSIPRPRARSRGSRAPPSPIMSTL